MKNNNRSTLTIKSMTQIALFAAFIAVCSWITVPTTIPFTLQLFAVFLALEILGGTQGTFAILLYLLLGAIGLPVFHGFRGGVSVFFEATGGYLLGFVLIGLLHRILEIFLKKKKWKSYLSFSLGLLLCYLFGTLWFAKFYFGDTTLSSALPVALQIGILPFLLPDFIKLFVAISFGRQIKKLAPDLFTK